MSRDTRNFETLMNKYGLASPVSKGAQEYAISSGRLNLKRILKQSGQYSLFLWLAYSSIGWMKRIGLHLSLLQGKVLVSVVSANVALSIAAGGYYTAARIIEHRTGERAEELRQPLPVQAEERADKDSGTQSPAPSAQAIGISEFSGTDAVMARRATTILHDSLKENLGVPVVRLGADGRASTYLVIIGSTRNLGDECIITVKAVDAKSSRMVFITSRTVPQGEATAEAIRDISLQLRRFIRAEGKR